MEMPNSIAFITVCKGRLHHLRQTLPLNIINNHNYPKVKFYLLDYNSTDGMDRWVYENMREPIMSGLLEYYKNPSPKYFQYSHSKNQMLRLVKEDIVVNLDADNFTGNGFAHYINNNMNMQSKNFLLGCKYVGNTFEPIIPEDPRFSGVYGRIATWTKVAQSIGGYDEQFKDWGFEDTDFYMRLIYSGLKPNVINVKHLNCINHTDIERVSETKGKDIEQKRLDFMSYQRKMLDEIHNGSIFRNNGDYGKGVVYKNFSKTPIILD